MNTQSYLIQVSTMPSALLKQVVSQEYPAVVSGEGVWLYDENGRSYLDGSSGAMTANIGHGVSDIGKVMQEQSDTVAFTYRTQFTNAPAEALASRLCALAPDGIDYAFFVNSGSEASEHAMRVALDVWRERDKPKKVKILGRKRSYHGMTMGALSMSGHDARRVDYGSLLHSFPVVPPAYCYRCPWGLDPNTCHLECANAWESAIVEAGSDTVAAVIAEPIVGAAGGVLMPPRSYFRQLRKICDQYDVLMIMDEVITGLGRTGDWFASAQEGVIPDIILTGKGTSAGYTPMAAVLMHNSLVASMRNGSGQAPYGHTFSGNPLSSAICLAVLDYLDEHEVLANVKARGRELEAGLKDLAQRVPSMVDIRGRGLLWGFEFVLDAKSRKAPETATDTAAQFAKKCFDSGLLVYPAGVPPLNNAAIVAPPLTITAGEIEELLRRLSSALSRMEATVLHRT